MADEIILVAGCNYAKYEATNSAKTVWKLEPLNAGPWRAYCLRWAANALVVNKGVKITLFDFFLGTRETLAADKSGKVVATVDVTIGKLIAGNYRRRDDKASSLVPPEKSFRTTGDQPEVRYFMGASEIGKGPVSFADYNKKFSGAKAVLPSEKSISITDVYDYLLVAGKSRPNTVTEFHVFSHGFAGGPILVNTEERKGLSSRDPFDKDGRSLKDFDPANINQKQLAAAFAKDAIGFIWGCNAFTFMKKLLHFTLAQKVKIADPDDKKFQFEWSQDWIENLAFFHVKLGGDTKSNQSAALNLNQITTVLFSAVFDTYMQKMALAVNIKVLGGLPGTYSTPDTIGAKAQQFLHVPRGPATNDPTDDNFTRALTFYRDELGFNFEPTRFGGTAPFGRGYGVYTP